MQGPPADEPALSLRRGDGSALRLDGSRCAIMAILNVTPDSFSDGGRYADSAAAIPRAHELIAAGADILDIGAESTRPGAPPISAAEEWQRLEPIVGPLAAAQLPVVLSIDTRHAESARRAAAAGFRMLNLTFPQELPRQLSDAASLASVLKSFDAIVLMHSRGTPATMRELTDYGDDLCQTVVTELHRTVASFSLGGEPSMSLTRSQLIFDPGLGFAKTAEQSLELLARLCWLRRALGGRLLIGASRKSMLGAITGLPTSERTVPSAVAAAFAAYFGADIVRVHDVRETMAALQLAAALRRSAASKPAPKESR